MEQVARTNGDPYERASGRPPGRCAGRVRGRDTRPPTWARHAALRPAGARIARSWREDPSASRRCRAGGRRTGAIQRRGRGDRAHGSRELSRRRTPTRTQARNMRNCRAARPDARTQSDTATVRVLLMDIDGIKEGQRLLGPSGESLMMQVAMAMPRAIRPSTWRALGGESLRAGAQESGGGSSSASGSPRGVEECRWLPTAGGLSSEWGGPEHGDTRDADRPPPRACTRPSRRATTSRGRAARRVKEDDERTTLAAIRVPEAITSRTCGSRGHRRVGGTRRIRRWLGVVRTYRSRARFWATASVLHASAALAISRWRA